jgi:hypothetical protein
VSSRICEGFQELGEKEVHERKLIYVLEVFQLKLLHVYNILATLIGVSCTFSSHKNIWQNIFLDTMTFNAALTENGNLTCSVQKESEGFLK